MRGTKNTWKIVLVSIVVAGLIIFSGYAYGRYKEDKFLAEDSGKQTEQAQPEENTEAQPKKTDFPNHRGEATLAEYLDYVHQENETVSVSALTNMGESREWLREGLTQVAGQIDMDKNRLDYSEHQSERLNSEDLLDNTDWEAIASEGSELALVAFPNSADYRDSLPVEDSIDNARTIYRNLRIANPEAQVVFLTLPAESDTFNNDPDYLATVQQFNDALVDANMNVIDFVNTDNSLISQEFEKYDENGLAPESYNHLIDNFVEVVTKQKFDLTLGFKGENDEEIETLEQEAEEAAAKAEQEAAEQQAAAEAAQQRQQQAAEEAAVRQREQQEEEAVRQRRQEAEERQQQEEAAQESQPTPSVQQNPEQAAGGDASAGAEAAPEGENTVNNPGQPATGDAPASDNAAATPETPAQ